MKPSMRADGRQVDVAARLVGLGLQRELQVVLLVAHVVAEEVERVAEALQASSGFLAASVSDALAAAPEDVDLRAQLDAQVDGAHRLLQRVGAHLRRRWR